MSHMIADDEADLHGLAALLGLKRAWFQSDHYDVSIAKRDEAIRLGAVKISLRVCSAMCFLRRMGREMGDPDTAQARMFEAMAEKKP